MHRDIAIRTRAAHLLLGGALTALTTCGLAGCDSSTQERTQTSATALRADERNSDDSSADDSERNDGKSADAVPSTPEPASTPESAGVPLQAEDPVTAEPPPDGSSDPSKTETPPPDGEATDGSDSGKDGDKADDPKQPTKTCFVGQFGKQMPIDPALLAGCTTVVIVQVQCEGAPKDSHGSFQISEPFCTKKDCKKPKDPTTGLNCTIIGTVEQTDQTDQAGQTDQPTPPPAPTKT